MSAIIVENSGPKVAPVTKVESGSEDAFLKEISSKIDALIDGDAVTRGILEENKELSEGRSIDRTSKGYTPGQERFFD